MSIRKKKQGITTTATQVKNIKLYASVDLPMCLTCPYLYLHMPDWVHCIPKALRQVPIVSTLAPTCVVIYGYSLVGAVRFSYLRKSLSRAWLACLQPSPVKMSFSRQGWKSDFCRFIHDLGKYHRSCDPPSSLQCLAMITWNLPDTLHSSWYLWDSKGF